MQVSLTRHPFMGPDVSCWRDEMHRVRARDIDDCTEGNAGKRCNTAQGTCNCFVVAIKEVNEVQINKLTNQHMVVAASILLEPLMSTSSKSAMFYGTVGVKDLWSPESR